MGQKEKTNLILVGYRAVGKSTLSKKLRGKLGLRRICTDKVIEKKLGMSIKDYVAKNDWPSFRKVETEVLKEYSSQKGLILDTGGGIVHSQENRDLIKNAGVVIYLHTDFSALIYRLKLSNKRPPLKPGVSLEDEVRSLLEERDPWYSEVADRKVKVNRLFLARVLEEIISHYKELA